MLQVGKGLLLSTKAGHRGDTELQSENCTFSPRTKCSVQSQTLLSPSLFASISCQQRWNRCEPLLLLWLQTLLYFPWQISRDPSGCALLPEASGVPQACRSSSNNVRRPFPALNYLGTIIPAGNFKLCFCSCWCHKTSKGPSEGLLQWPVGI